MRRPYDKHGASEDTLDLGELALGWRAWELVDSGPVCDENFAVLAHVSDVYSVVRYELVTGYGYEMLWTGMLGPEDRDEIRLRFFPNARVLTVGDHGQSENTVPRYRLRAWQSK